VALGLPAHPCGEKDQEELHAMWSLVPHRALAPVRTSGISASST
jgi:hypothetical protein